MKLEIVTPVRKLVSVECQNIRIPGYKGQLGVLPQHAQLVSQLITGVVVYEVKGQEMKVAVKEGFIQVNEDNILLLADDGMTQETVNRESLQTEQKEMEQKLISPEIGIEEREKLFIERNWLNAKMAL